MGDTGSGKTTLGNLLLYARDYTLSFRSKSDDAPLPGVKIRTATQFGARSDIDRYVLDPAYERQLPEFWDALDTVWRQGHWTVYLDELWYLTTLKTRSQPLKERIDRLLTQGRSKKITVVCGMQRPVQISRFALSQSTHLIAFRCDGRDVKGTLREAGNDEWAQVVGNLKRYEFAWFYRPERCIWTGRVQDLLPQSLT